MKKWNFKSGLFYIGVVVILLCSVGIIWLVANKKANMSTTSKLSELPWEYLSWYYINDWEETVGATVDYKPGDSGETAKYIIEFDEGAEHYRIVYRPGKSAYISRECPYAIGSCEGNNYINMSTQYVIDSDYIWDIFILYENGDSELYYPYELYELSEKETLSQAQIHIWDALRDKIDIIAKQQNKDTYIGIIVTTAVVLGIWFFFMPPVESLQKNEGMRKKRAVGLGILTITLGVWFSVPGGIAAVYIERMLEKNLPQKDPKFFAKVFVPSMVINLAVKYIGPLLMMDTVFVMSPELYLIFSIWTVLGMYLGYGAFGIKFSCLCSRENKRKRNENT